MLWRSGSLRRDVDEVLRGAGFPLCWGFGVGDVYGLFFAFVGLFFSRRTYFRRLFAN